MNDGTRKLISICYFLHYLCFKSFEKWYGKLHSKNSTLNLTLGFNQTHHNIIQII